MGAIMLAVLAFPAFSASMGAAATISLLVPAAAVIVRNRVKAREPLTGSQKSVAGLVVVDIGFMALALLMMTAHHGGQSHGDGAPMGGMSGHMGHMAAVDGGLMNMLVLLGWTVCAAVMALPAVLERRRGMAPHALCSACMILAMSVMAL